MKKTTIVISIIVGTIIGLWQLPFEKVSTLNPFAAAATAVDDAYREARDERYAQTRKQLGLDKPVVNSKKQAFAWNGKITAYTSQRRQTDSTPCTPAIHMNICREHDALHKQIPQKNFFFCAAPQHDGTDANGLEIPFGTILNVQGLGKCKVVDRLSERATPNQLDLYFGRADETRKAIDFGVKYRTISVVKWGSGGETRPDEFYAHLRKY